MTLFEILSGLLTVAALFAYLNQRWLRLPPAIALMAMTLASSLVLLAIDKLGLVDVGPLARVVERVRFDQTLLHGMLGALLFAGALHVRVDDLREQKVPVGVLALVGTLLSTASVATLTFFASRAVGAPVPLGACVLFGAIISPTDPVAVLGILKEARVPKAMEVQITGESLFNDGIGVVAFTTVLDVLSRGSATWSGVALLFAREVLGGAAFGFASGYLVYRVLSSIDHYQTELLVTIALVCGGYVVAEHLHVSAPIFAVVAGLVIGNQGRNEGMSDVTRDHLDKFWSLVDEILNAVLFVLVGLEVVRLPFSRGEVGAGLLAIPLVLVSRWASVAVPVVASRRRERIARGTIAVLTWGGLRGGISIALALSTPDGPDKSLLVTMTYFVVAFSILVQGLSLGRLARRFTRAPAR
jgi:CPA1 family monovalent cation:H+ antiporter